MFMVQNKIEKYPVTILHDNILYSYNCLFYLLKKIKYKIQMHGTLNTYK